MNIIHRCGYRRLAFLMPAIATSAATVVAIFIFTCAVRGQTLVYSFEDDLQGFSPNGGGLTVAQDIIGATQGTQSMKVSVVGGATFVGALSDPVPVPAALGDPPGIDYVLFDMTITEPFGPQPPPEPAPFAVIGITIFGHSQPDYPGGQQFGLQAQFRGDPVGSEELHIDGLAAGTYTDMQINLSAAFHPLTFEGPFTFNEIFGSEGSGEYDLIPSGFQFYINKSSFPLTVYIDNVRFVDLTPDGVDGDYNDDGTVDAADYVIWRKNENTLNTLPNDPDGGEIGEAQYQTWLNHFGESLTVGEGGGAQTAPEPASSLLMAIALIVWCGMKRRGIGLVTR